jgi:opacity protein-like surface antigen
MKLYLFCFFSLLSFNRVFTINHNDCLLEKKYPLVVSTCDPCIFNGFYLGLNLCYGAIYADHLESSNWSGGAGMFGDSFSVSEFAPGARFGYSHKFLNNLYCALEFNAHLLNNSMRIYSNGSYSGQTYFEEERFSFNWQYGLSGHLGLLVKPSTIIYLIGGLEYVPCKYFEKYKFTTGEQNSATNRLNLLGALVGLGVGISLDSHWEVRLEATQTFFQKESFEEIHLAADDLLNLTTRKVLGVFSIIYRH